MSFKQSLTAILTNELTIREQEWKQTVKEVFVDLGFNIVITEIKFGDVKVKEEEVEVKIEEEEDVQKEKNELEEEEPPKKKQKIQKYALTSETPPVTSSTPLIALPLHTPPPLPVKDKRKGKTKLEDLCAHLVNRNRWEIESSLLSKDWRKTVETEDPKEILSSCMAWSASNKMGKYYRLLYSYKLYKFWENDEQQLSLPDFASVHFNENMDKAKKYLHDGEKIAMIEEIMGDLEFIRTKVFVKYKLKQADKDQLKGMLLEYNANFNK